jgi:hypothetical protein
MKNLSFLISIVIAISIFFSCRNNKNNTKLENQSVIEKTAIDDAAENNELNSMKNKTANKQDTLSKDSIYHNRGNKEKKEIPKHNDPEQAEIDSIKKAKEKLKK